MARLFQSGFELNSITADMEWTTINGTPVIVTSGQRSGTYAFEDNALQNATPHTVGHSFASVAGNGPFFARFYLKVATSVNAVSAMAAFKGTANGSSKCAIRLNTNDTLTLRDLVAPADVGTTSALTKGVWKQTTLDSMQIGYTQDVTNVQAIAVSNVWASVDYTPAGSDSSLLLMGIGT